MTAGAEFFELTARGCGAISVIGVRGQSARDCLADCFEPVAEKSFRELSARSIVYGHWKSTREDLLVVQVANNTFEVQCHGSLAAVASIKSDLASSSAIESTAPASWMANTNAFQAEILDAMQRCSTERTATHLLQQYHLWADPDFTDPVAMKTALSFEAFGKKLTSPWQIVLCGRPNVGKSSLINALCGFERAIVNEMAGTTRDLVSQQTAIDGWPVELIDSAGIRESENQIERKGVAKAIEVIQSADLVLHVVDASADTGFESEVSQERAGIVVVNKIDLCERSIAPDVDCPVLQVSAKTGAGVDQLLAAISQAIVPVEASTDQLVPVTESQAAALRDALNTKA